ncbi:TlpA family protein disulfide reductase [Parachryseolinea silvisoli]|uniref:TlpA family protein disulfide reductase n=1 Tax=Parachryseolinea silvisoli TaxID=2873601 RepID=UPI002265EFBA|nr:TlpA disulfide reductase family protein [Parachryseolinea silvisoli]MCD9019952.1 TlpA family protein disulfide reductase [Parachryseolinea silvisoli]
MILEPMGALKFYFCICLYFVCPFLYSQSIPSAPVVGRPVPEFQLEDIFDFETKAAKSADFKGRWLFLDFWFKGCTSCIKSMPKINQLQEHFRDRAVFMLVGLMEGGDNRSIKALYGKFKDRQNLNIPHVFDTALIKRWGIKSMPHIVVVNPDGVVKFVTDGRDLTVSKVDSLIGGADVKFYKKDDFNNSKEGDAENGLVIFRSSLTKWQGETQAIYDVDSYVRLFKKTTQRNYKAIMIPLYGLYNEAYVGQFTWIRRDSLYDKFYPKPILEVSDSSLFDYDYNVNIGKGIYNYSLILPPDRINRSDIMCAMQNDLKRAFGYETLIEFRDVSVWKLIVVSERLKNKLLSKGGKLSYPPSFAGGFKLRNYPANELIDIISRYISDEEPPYIDFTGMKGNIDIAIDADMTDREQIRRELNRNGLDLVKGKMKMWTLIIRDPIKSK